MLTRSSPVGKPVRLCKRGSLCPLRFEPNCCSPRNVAMCHQQRCDPSPYSFGLIGFEEPSGAAMFPGGVSPCGLEAGAPPPLGVVVGAVVSALPFASGCSGRPIASRGAVGFSDWLCAPATEVAANRQTTASEMRMNPPSGSSQPALEEQVPNRNETAYWSTP